MSYTIDQARQVALSKGEIPSRTLTEIIKIDFDVLMETLVPGIILPSLGKEGISRKMVLCADALLVQKGPLYLAELAQHVSDTVRGLAIFGLARYYSKAPLSVILDVVRPFAADLHFGVREWAWLSVRAKLVQTLDESVAALAGWTGDSDVNLRRFAVESLRPRGVWCKHIAELRAEPARGLPLLEPMRAETEKYAQDSVANWLNDAAKDNPDWVQALCRRWQNASPDNAATKRIIARATRSFR